MIDTPPTPTPTPKTERRGGPRHTDTDRKITKIKRVTTLIGLGLGIEAACKRANTSAFTIRKWANELGIKFTH